VYLPHVTGDVTVRTVSGNLTADSINGSVSVKSISGEIRIDSLHHGNATVQSVSGNIELGIAPGTNIDLDAGSTSGKLNSQIPLSPTPNDHAGPTLTIRGNTISGDLQIFRAA
jgi:DUF4097 and DUF4098 domain-containing protein YvlB